MIPGSSPGTISSLSYLRRMPVLYGTFGHPSRMARDNLRSSAHSAYVNRLGPANQHRKRRSGADHGAQRTAKARRSLPAQRARALRPGERPVCRAHPSRLRPGAHTGLTNRALCPVSGRCVGELPPRGREAQRRGSGGSPPGPAPRSGGVPGGRPRASTAQRRGSGGSPPGPAPRSGGVPGGRPPGQHRYTAAGSSSSTKPRVLLGSTGMPGPMVVVIVAFLT